MGENSRGIIYTIADGVKVIQNKAGYWTLHIHEKGEKHRRNLEIGEEGLKRAITAAEWRKSNRSRQSHGTNERYASVCSQAGRCTGSMVLRQVVCRMSQNHKSRLPKAFTGWEDGFCDRICDNNSVWSNFSNKIKRGAEDRIWFPC